jgi:hypothetical protein
LLFAKQKEGNSEFVGKYGDNWVGPVYRETVDIAYARTEIILVLEHVPQPGGHHSKIQVELFVDGRRVAKEKRSQRGQFGIKTVIDRNKTKGNVTLELRTHPYFIPRLISNATDDRKLSMLHLETIVGAATT